MSGPFAVNPDREAAFGDWHRNVILGPAPATSAVAHEAFCAGWEAQQEHDRAKSIVSAVFACGSEDCPRPFALYRHQDVTGVSGKGIVATGVRFADGQVVIRWRGETPSTVVWESFDAAMRVHGHDGKTRVVWLAAEFSEMAKAEQEAAAAERSRLFVAIRHGISLDKPWRGEALDLIDALIREGRKDGDAP